MWMKAFPVMDSAVQPRARICILRHCQCEMQAPRRPAHSFVGMCDCLCRLPPHYPPMRLSSLRALFGPRRTPPPPLSANFDVGPAVAAAERQAANAPVTIVFASAPYLPLLANWLGFAHRSGETNVLVAALDRETVDGARAGGIACTEFPPVTSLEELWVARAQMFAALASAGVDFIHSDADAVWLRSPRDAAFVADVDIAFSTGTTWPSSVVKRWGFVACCGFFAARGTPAAAAFFAEVATRARVARDDQIAVNEALVAAGVIWDKPHDDRRVHKKIPFRIFPQTIVGKAGDLRVALLPHGQFARLPEVTPETLVAHPIAPRISGDNGITRQVNILKELGLWRLPEVRPAA